MYFSTSNRVTFQFSYSRICNVYQTVDDVSVKLFRDDKTHSAFQTTYDKIDKIFTKYNLLAVSLTIALTKCCFDWISIHRGTWKSGEINAHSVFQNISLAYSLLHPTRLKHLAGQNQVNIATSMSYPFCRFIHAWASLIYPISFRTWQVTHFSSDTKWIRNSVWIRRSKMNIKKLEIQ